MPQNRFAGFSIFAPVWIAGAAAECLSSWILQS
ncbi:hypothetical protein MOBUDSM44075_04722 [Mycolicibacterium obuense]|uniref:Uncharacterized protein n=1 Tax=Mycolicibacterium obuense TaxID=1807 RepID=A0A0J6VI79_9MYCO|nr:hypothetical protein MOBUDSM44075_04722 [Mycolicibacterium obuense]